MSYKGHPVDYYGFMQDITIGSKIKNLNIEGELNYKNDEEFTLQYIRVGGLIGRNDGGTVENCTINIDVNVDLPKCNLIFNSEAGNHNRSIFVGGVIGNNEGIINKCKNYGNVNVNVVRNYRNDITEIDKGINEVGGIAGDNKGAIVNSINYGNVQYKGDSINTTDYTLDETIGGIAGKNNSDKGVLSMTTVIENCINKGNVSADTKEKSFVAGITGKDDPRSLRQTTMNNVYNYGKVSCTTHNTGKSLYIGGIVGDPDTNIENCFNIGQVTHITDPLESTTKYLGAIAGYLHSDANFVNTKYLQGSAPYGVYRSGGVGQNEDKLGHTIESITNLSEEQVIEELNGFVITHNGTYADYIWVEWNITEQGIEQKPGIEQEPEISPTPEEDNKTVITLPENLETGEYTLKYEEQAGKAMEGYSDICTINTENSNTYKGFIEQNIAPEGATAIGIYEKSTGDRKGEIALNSIDYLDSSELQDQQKEYSFVALSDVHVGRETTTKDHLAKALKYANDSNDIKFTAICGDLSYQGTKNNLDSYKQTVDENKGSKEVYAIAGNHEAYDTSGDQRLSRWIP